MMTRQQIHSLYQKINFLDFFSCQQQVSKFFEPAIVENGDQRCDVSFRGRPLNGRKVQLADDYILSNLKPSNKDDEEFVTTERSAELTYWNFDQQPDTDDKVNQAMNWLNISKALMSNVTMDELNQFDLV